MPTTPNLRDAVMVVLKTQELAGIDVIRDGELSRFDVGHPETNGMIEYFVRPLAGVDSQLSRDDVAAFRAQQGMGFRTQPAAVVRGPLGDGTLDLPAAWSFVQPLAHAPLKFTVTASYMLAKTLLDQYYGDLCALTMAVAEVLRRQVAEIDAPVLQIDEANLTGHPEDASWAHEPINHVLNAARGNKVVADPLADTAPAAPATLDWEATLAYRRYLWSLGFAVAEAMDTAQRGMGLDWPAAQELIRRSIAEARAVGGTVACGAGTDQLLARPDLRLEAVEAAYEEQIGFVEGLGGRIILMASRALAATAQGADDYVRVYDRLLSQVKQPVIIHWLGTMFDPQLANYWGSHDLDAAMDTCLHVIGDHAAKIDGVKISLLDKDREIAMRRRLPPGVRMYTGDDFNYAELIQGDEHGHSDALLGIFDPIAPAAAAAFSALDAGDTVEFNRLLAPTVPLSRHIFRSPTYSYKTQRIASLLAGAVEPRPSASCGRVQCAPDW